MKDKTGSSTVFVPIVLSMDEAQAALHVLRIAFGNMMNNAIRQDEGLALRAAMTAVARAIDKAVDDVVDNGLGNER